MNAAVSCQPHQRDRLERLCRYVTRPPLALDRRYADDFDAAIGDVVAAGLDTDCNGATVGALWALQGKPIPEHWTAPWQGRVGVSLAGIAEIELDTLVARTVTVAQQLA